MFMVWIILALLFLKFRVAEPDKICTFILGFVGLLNESARFLTTFWLMLFVVGCLGCSTRGVVRDSQPEL